MLARLCQRVENEFVGANCGIMDQFISANGKENHALLLDCRDLSYQLAPIPANVALVIANTMVKHSVAGGDYTTPPAASRKKPAPSSPAIVPEFPSCATPRSKISRSGATRWSPNALMRARHVISEELCAPLLPPRRCIAAT